MRIALVLMLLSASAYAEPEKETAAEQSAKAWLATVLDAKATIVAPTKDQPLDYLLESPAKSCRGLASGRATKPAEAKRVKSCLFDTWKGLSLEPTSPELSGDGKPEETFNYFAKKYRKHMKEVAKDATIVSVMYMGDGLSMHAAIVVAKDGAIRAIWMQRGEFE